MVEPLSTSPAQSDQPTARTEPPASQWPAANEPTVKPKKPTVEQKLPTIDAVQGYQRLISPPKNVATATPLASGSGKPDPVKMTQDQAKAYVAQHFVATTGGQDAHSKHRAGPMPAAPGPAVENQEVPTTIGEFLDQLKKQGLAREQSSGPYDVALQRAMQCLADHASTPNLSTAGQRFADIVKKAYPEWFKQPFDEKTEIREINGRLLFLLPRHLASRMVLYRIPRDP